MLIVGRRVLDHASFAADGPVANILSRIASTHSMIGFRSAPVRKRGSWPISAFGYCTDSTSRMSCGCRSMSMSTVSSAINSNLVGDKADDTRLLHRRRRMRNGVDVYRQVGGHPELWRAGAAQCSTG